MMTQFHHIRTLLTVLILLVVSLTEVQANDTYPITLEKKVAMDQIVGVPNTVIFKLFEDQSTLIPVAVQSFGPGEWAADIIRSFVGGKIQEVARFKVLFTEIASLRTDMSLWMELVLDGQTIGERERVTKLPWAHFSQQAKKLPEADYDSGWFLMSSQAGDDSYKEVTHNLGVYPTRVKVLVRAIDGNNDSFIFEGVGSAQQDDDGGAYGGVLFAYDQATVRLWAPTVNNQFAEGRIINIGDGWGNEINSQYSNTADVRVLVWR